MLNKVESYDDPLLEKIRNDLLKVDPRVATLRFRASNESFTEDKKTIYLCLKDRKTNEYYDYNMLMYVCLHELAHAFSESVDEDHTTKEFRDNFQMLLDKAEKLGLYNPNLPLNYNYCPRSE
jgi:elongation factor P--beta-lysine ligase